MNLVEELREKKTQLIITIDTTFEEMIRKVESLESGELKSQNSYESIFPLASCSTFKGKKPISVTFGKENIVTPTWKSVVEIILKEVIKNEEMKEKLFALRNRILGRVRNRIAATNDNMRSPIEVCEDLYIESHYDTKMLLDLLIQILNEIHFDYSKIKVTIKN